MISKRCFFISCPVVRSESLFHPLNRVITKQVRDRNNLLTILQYLCRILIERFSGFDFPGVKEDDLRLNQYYTTLATLVCSVAFCGWLARWRAKPYVEPTVCATLFSTGVDEQGHHLPFGNRELHWCLCDYYIPPGKPVSGTLYRAGSPLFAALGIFGSYAISPDPNRNFNQECPRSGYYTYGTSFSALADQSGFAGTIKVDDGVVSASLNGTPLALDMIGKAFQRTINDSARGEFFERATFQIGQPAPGTNTLKIVTMNQGPFANPHSFEVEVSPLP
jgi:hypothetical protein